jgi:hypothetical protein
MPDPEPAPMPDHLSDLRAKAEQLAACGDVMSRELLAAWAAVTELRTLRADLAAVSGETVDRIVKWLHDEGDAFAALPVAMSDMVDRGWPSTLLHNKANELAVRFRLPDAPLVPPRDAGEGRAT